MADQDQDNLDLYGPDDVNDETLYGDDEEEASAPLEPSFTVDSHPSSTTAAPATNPPPPSSSTSTLPTHASLPANPNSLAFSKKISPPTFDGSLESGSAGGNGGGGPTLRPSEMEGEGKMFIGGLNWETTDETLKSYFEKFGPVEACTIMRDPTGRSRGFAFLTFEQGESVDKVLGELHVVDGKPIDPKRAIPHDEHRKAAKIFVGGLHASTTIEVLRQFFSSYGQVLDAQVMLDRESARSKGFGFVTFADEEACERALAVGRMEIEGKQVEVKKAQPRAGRDRDSNHSGGPSNGGHRQSNPNGGLSNSSVPGGGMPNFNGAPGGQQQGMYNPMGMGGQFGGMGYGGGFGMGMNGMGMQAGGGAGGGPVDPNMMARMFSMMNGMNPAMSMGRPGQPPMMNPQFMMPSFNPMMGQGSPMGGVRPGMPGMAGPMGMMGMRPPMGMGGMGMMGMGMPFMMPQQQGGPMAPNAAGSVSPASISAISATPMRQTGSRSPNTAATGGPAGGQGQQQGPGPARSNTRGQSHFKPY